MSTFGISSRTIVSRSAIIVLDVVRSHNQGFYVKYEPQDTNGHTKEGVSGIKHLYLVQPICLPDKGTIYICPLKRGN